MFSGATSIPNVSLPHIERTRHLHARPGPGSTPTDLALSKNGQFLFSVNPGSGTIAGWRIGSDGALAFTGAAAGIPASASGIADVKEQTWTCEPGGQGYPTWSLAEDFPHRDSSTATFAIRPSRFPAVFKAAVRAGTALSAARPERGDEAVCSSAAAVAAPTRCRIYGEAAPAQFEPITVHLPLVVTHPHFLSVIPNPVPRSFRVIKRLVPRSERIE